MSHVDTRDHYCAQRDRCGHIRLDCGHGIIIAYASESPDVLRLTQWATTDFNEHEWAAVWRLLDTEAQAVTTPDLPTTERQS